MELDDSSDFSDYSPDDDLEQAMLEGQPSIPNVPPSRRHLLTYPCITASLSCVWT